MVKRHHYGLEHMNETSQKCENYVVTMQCSSKTLCQKFKLPATGLNICPSL